MNAENKPVIKAIIGLGNPGRQYENTRHNIGFKVVDALCDRYNCSWRLQNHMEVAPVIIDGRKIILIKPQTFMNDSGRIIPLLQKQGIGAENILVVHDELEIPFGNVKLRAGGSARGHNGLKSLIEYCGQEFMRLRFGIARPENKQDVARYVLSDFSESPQEINLLIDQAVDIILRTIE